MKKFQIIALITAAVCLVSIGIFSVVQTSLASKLDTQTVCERWASDGTRYAQLSAFISPHAGFTGDSADYSLKQSLDAAMVEASLEPASEDARLYAYGYSAEQTVSMSRINPETGAIAKSGVRATALGVGGDFFLFHPTRLLSGSYFDPDETIPGDMIVIDNIIAWQFFGSPDVVGRELLVNGRSCYISGVIEVDEDYEQFYGDGGRIFVRYGLLSELVGDLPVTCYEICMPDPVKGFAVGILEKNIGIDESYVEIVENSARFTDGGLASRLGGFAERSVRTKLVSYPYWENTAVILTDRAALLYIGKLVPIVILVLIAAVELVLAYINRRRFYRFVGKSVTSALDKRSQDRRRKKREKLERHQLKLAAKKQPALAEGKTPEPIITEKTTEPVEIDNKGESE